MLLAIILQFGARMLTFLPRFFVALQTLLAIQLSHLDKKGKEYKVEVYSSGYLALNQMKDCIMKRKVLRMATGLPVACNCVLSLSASESLFQSNSKAPINSSDSVCDSFICLGNASYTWFVCCTL